MLKIDEASAEPQNTESAPAEPKRAGSQVTLACGAGCSLDGMNSRQLHELQWEQEQAFARAIRDCPAGSAERRALIQLAYDTVCTILSASRGDSAGELTMGMDARYSRLVLQLLRSQVDFGMDRPAFFEMGYGSGVMIEEVRGHGFEAGGIEVSLAMREHALARLGPRPADSLLLGDVRDVTSASLHFRPTVIYSNDVFEHIPVDEIQQVADHLYSLLPQYGALVTITPNWLLRPSDVTGDFCPPRTEACGLHLKEYRLAEMVALLRQAGFRRVETPLLATKGRFLNCGSGGLWFKLRLEPHLDRLPVRLAHLLCRGLAMSCTVATK